MEAFESFDFDSSSAWKRYQEDSVLTTDADALLLAKAKWYKKNVVEDEGFDVDLVRKKISSRGGRGDAAASGSSRSAPAPAPPPQQPKPRTDRATTTTRTTTAAPRTPAAASAAASRRTKLPLLSSLSPRALHSSLSSASPADAAALASRLATLATGLAFLLACASAWLSFFGVYSTKLLLGGGEEDYYSPRRGRRAASASASAAAFRKFALSASVSHFAALVQRCGAPPVAAAFPGGLGSFDPRAAGPVLAWLRRASEAPDASLLFFLMLSSSSPSAAAAVPSLVAALLALLESSAGGSSSSGPGGKLLGRVLFPGPVRPFLLEPRRQRAARAAAAASELAQGLWLVLSTVLGRGGGFLTAMGFWRTYVPMRLRSSSSSSGSGSSSSGSGGGGEFRAAAVGLAGGAARAARKVSGGGGGGVAGFFERLEARLRHSD